MDLKTRYVNQNDGGTDSIQFKTALGMAADATAGLNPYTVEWNADKSVITIDYHDGEGPQTYVRES